MKKAVRYYSRLGSTKTIAVADDYFYAHMLRIQARTEAAKAFGNKT